MKTHLLLYIFVFFAKSKEINSNANVRYPHQLKQDPLGGPNVCNPESEKPCCDGWIQEFRHGPCVKPLCNPPCRGGVCIKPNMCHCRDGTTARQCQHARRQKYSRTCMMNHDGFNQGCNLLEMMQMNNGNSHHQNQMNKATTSCVTGSCKDQEFIHRSIQESESRNQGSNTRGNEDKYPRNEERKYYVNGYRKNIPQTQNDETFKFSQDRKGVSNYHTRGRYSIENTRRNHYGNEKPLNTYNAGTQTSKPGNEKDLTYRRRNLNPTYDITHETESSVKYRSPSGEENRLFSNRRDRLTSYLSSYRRGTVRANLRHIVNPYELGNSENSFRNRHTTRHGTTNELKSDRSGTSNRYSSNIGESAREAHDPINNDYKRNNYNSYRQRSTTNKHGNQIDNVPSRSYDETYRTEGAGNGASVDITMSSHYSDDKLRSSSYTSNVNDDRNVHRNANSRPYVVNPYDIMHSKSTARDNVREQNERPRGTLSATGRAHNEYRNYGYRRPHNKPMHLVRNDGTYIIPRSFQTPNAPLRCRNSKCYYGPGPRINIAAPLPNKICGGQRCGIPHNSRLIQILSAPCGELPCGANKKLQTNDKVNPMIPCIMPFCDIRNRFNNINTITEESSKCLNGNCGTNCNTANGCGRVVPHCQGNGCLPQPVQPNCGGGSCNQDEEIIIEDNPCSEGQIFVEDPNGFKTCQDMETFFEKNT